MADGQVAAVPQTGKDWQTSLGGILALIGGGMAATGDPKLVTAGAVVSGIGGLLTGVYATQKRTVPAPIVDHSYDSGPDSAPE